MSAVSIACDKRRILLVDDVELNRVLTEAVLRGATYEVDCVGDGAAALAAVGRNSYDLVLMDLEMPGVDGHTAAAAIKRETRQTKIAALSAHGGDRHRERSRASGMSAHIARPITPHELLREIERVFCQPVELPWDRSCYDEWAARLGAAKMHGVLSKLLEQMESLQTLLDADGLDHKAVHHKAHDLASTAGMLGFHEVMRRARDIQAPPDEIHVHAVGPLTEALQRAIVVLEDHIDAEGMRNAAA